MTTTITVTTYYCPIAVTIHSEHRHEDDNTRSNGYSSTSMFVPAGTSQSFHISQGSNATFEELPAEARSLSHFYELREKGVAVGSVGGNRCILSGGAINVATAPPSDEADGRNGSYEINQQSASNAEA